MKWAEMTPAERNTLVAERVMGQTQHLCNGTSLDFLEMPGEWRCGICGYQARYDAPIEHNAVPPNYSESMDAAWLIVDSAKFVRVNLEYDKLRYFREAEQPMRNDCILHLHGGMTTFAYGATMPEAICLAALRIAGVEIEQ